MPTFAGAEGLVNSRPLTYQSADVRDVSPVTPNHFLFGQLGGQCAPEVEEQIYYGVKRRWRHVQLLVQHLEAVDVRVSSNIKSKEKMAVSQEFCRKKSTYVVENNIRLLDGETRLSNIDICDVCWSETNAKSLFLSR